MTAGNLAVQSAHRKSRSILVTRLGSDDDQPRYIFNVPADLPAFAFGCGCDGTPDIRREELTAAELLSEFRHAWRRHNGTQWRWRIKLNQFDVATGTDDLIDLLDAAAIGEADTVPLEVRPLGS